MAGPVASLDEAIARIRSHRYDLEAAGVRYLALFGSLVHAEDQAESDVDVLYELAPGAVLSSGFYEGAQLESYLRRSWVATSTSSPGSGSTRSSSHASTPRRSP